MQSIKGFLAFVAGVVLTTLLLHFIFSALPEGIGTPEYWQGNNPPAEIRGKRCHKLTGEEVPCKPSRSSQEER